MRDNRNFDGLTTAVLFRAPRALCLSLLQLRVEKIVARRILRKLQEYNDGALKLAGTYGRWRPASRWRSLASDLA
jgi:hypothetical protein